MIDNENKEEEIDFEPEDEMGDIGAAQAKLKKIREELKEAKAKRDEYLDGWQRCKADSINARKEAALYADRSHTRGKESIVEDIIPVLDSFDMAIMSESWSTVAEEWRSGMERIQSQLLDVLARHVVERFGKAGDRFDHTLHEAIQEIDDVAGGSGEIVKVVRNGYRSGDRIIRPAQVIVKV